MTESQWRQKLTPQLVAAGAVVAPYVGSAMQRPGWPDMWVGHARWAGWVEWKGEHTALGLHQKLTLRQINSRRPGTAYVVRYPDKVEDSEGCVLSVFDGTGAGLLATLQELSR